MPAPPDGELLEGQLSPNFTAEEAISALKACAEDLAHVPTEGAPRSRTICHVSTAASSASCQRRPSTRKAIASRLTNRRVERFHRYVDLSNEQLYLASIGRVSPPTADQWEDGIRGNLEKLPTFGAAWAEIAARVPDDFFEDLTKLVPPPPRS
jgi:hypothetical protein